MYFVPRPKQVSKSWLDIRSTNSGRITEYETFISYKNEIFDQSRKSAIFSIRMHVGL